MLSYYSQNRKSDLWCKDFHKHETYHCLTQVPFLFANVDLNLRSKVCSQIKCVCVCVCVGGGGGGGGGGVVRSRSAKQQHVESASSTA